MELNYQSRLTVGYLPEHITPREIEILSLMALGNQNKEIASRLNISAETVKTHVKNILKKTNSNNKIEALIKTKWLTTSLLSTETNC
jgi:LuxR family maltose regulon positive regulatory protein